MNKKYVRKNYIWLGSNFKKLYLHKYNSQVIKIFSEAIIKEINLFVTYDIYNRYNMCYSKPDNNITLKNSKLFKANNKLKFFFDYFQKKKLNCVEFEIELVVEIPDKLSIVFRFKLSIAFRSKLSTSFRSKLSTC